jgi:hypothetical protein
MRSKFKWIFSLLMALSMHVCTRRTITGTVTDGTGPVPGVNVQ